MADYIPIWQSYICHVTSNSGYVEYSVYTGDTLIYMGKAHVAPNATTADIYLSNIVRDYLNSKITYVGGEDYQDEVAYSLPIRLVTGDVTREYIFFNDYSYEWRDMYAQNASILSRPMSDVVDYRQLLFCTFANFNTTSPLTINASYVDGIRIVNIETIDITNCATFTIDLIGIGSNKLVTIGDKKNSISYRVLDTGASYCLYYLNAYGGYDSLLIKGNVLRTDSMSRTESVRSVSDSYFEHGRRVLNNEVQRKWRLHTDYLTDAQWAKTHHLLGSSHVFLHDLDGGEIVPVVITSNEAEFKTYRNQGNKKSVLTIEVEAASKRIRR